MPATTTVEPKTQIAAAIRLLRQYQHQPDCPCSVFRDADDEGYCNVSHARWSRTVDRLLTTVTHG